MVPKSVDVSGSQTPECTSSDAAAFVEKRLEVRASEMQTRRPNRCTRKAPNSMRRRTVRNDVVENLLRGFINCPELADRSTPRTDIPKLSRDRLVE